MNPLQKTEEEEELGEEEEKADEAMEEVEQEVGPPLLTPLSEDAGKSLPSGQAQGQPSRGWGGGSSTPGNTDVTHPLSLSGDFLCTAGMGSGLGAHACHASIREERSRRIVSGPRFYKAGLSETLLCI